MKMKKPQTIFVCSMADLFGDWVPDHWIRYVMDTCDAAPWHTYIFLTKNPKRYLTTPGDFFKDNRWFGTSITNTYDAMQRLHWLQRLPAANTFVSFEPLLGPMDYIDLHEIRQVIIGAQTNPFKEPDHFTISLIEQEADRVGAKVFCKDSLSGSLFGDDFKRDLCWRVHK